MDLFFRIPDEGDDRPTTVALRFDNVQELLDMPEKLALNSFRYAFRQAKETAETGTPPPVSTISRIVR